MNVLTSPWLMCACGFGCLSTLFIVSLHVAMPKLARVSTRRGQLGERRVFHVPALM